MAAKRRKSDRRHPSKRQRTKERDVDGREEVIDLTMNTPPPPDKGPFRFLDLPSELRLEVYRYLLPCQVRFYFNDPQNAMSHLPMQKPKVQKSPQNPARSDATTGLFLVSKFVCNEARGVLYGDNTFVFKIDASAHEKTSLKSPEIFGPFRHPERMPLLRELRSVELNVSVTDLTHWAVLRHRARLEYFVSVLKEHSDDETQKSLLKKLAVNFSVAHYFDMFSMIIEDNARYGLEGLTSLRGIDEVQISGVPDWYAQCLQLCIQGKGGSLNLIDYPEVQVRKRASSTSTRWKKVFQTTKKWNDPKFNWKEFAERNGITVPEGDSL